MANSKLNKQIFDYLQKNSLIPYEVETISEMDKEDGYNTPFEKFVDWARIEDNDSYAVYKEDGMEYIFFLTEEGQSAYVEEFFKSASEPEDAMLSALKELAGNNYEALYEIWGMDIEDADGIKVVKTKTLSATKKTAAINFIKQAAGTGIGTYRRGKVLTDIKSVQPGQLLVWESLVFGAVNLVKVTETFDDKYYGIIVKPDNPVEKAKASDEEFVVYAQDLEKGEWYIALEPAPSEVVPAADEVTPATPAKDVKAPEGVNEDVATPAADTAVKGASKKTADSVVNWTGIEDFFDINNLQVSGGYIFTSDGPTHFKKDGDRIVWDNGTVVKGNYYNAIGNGEIFKSFDSCIDHPNEPDYLKKYPAPNSMKTASKKTAINSPVKVNMDYGTTKKLAFGEEPGCIVEVRYDADQERGKDSYVTEEDVEHTTFASYAELKPTKADKEESDEVEETEEKEKSEYKFLSFEEPSEDDMKLFDELESKITIGSDWNSASYNGKVIAKAKDESELAEKLFKWMEDNKVVNIVAIDEKGNPITYYIEKDGDLDQIVESTKESLPMGFGSATSIGASLISNIESFASATGGEGDSGDSYSLVDGRNFTGVDEHMLVGSVKEYLNGKATSFASLKDFAGFVEDIYGIESSEEELADAWHDEDADAIVIFIKTNAKKDELSN